MKKRVVSLFGLFMALQLGGCGLFDSYADKAAEQVENSLSDKAVEQNKVEISAEKNNSVNKADEPSQSVDSTNDDKKHVGESELRALLENATDETILYFICDDFDDDGTKEAFAATSENDADAEELLNGILDCISPYKIWFVSENKVEAMDSANFQDCFIYLNENTFKGGKKVVGINNFFSAHDSRTYFVTVENGNYVNLNVGEEYYYSSYFDEEGILHSMHYGFGDETVEVQEYLYYNGKIILADEYEEEW